jgi:hypothetical protein
MTSLALWFCFDLSTRFRAGLCSIMVPLHEYESFPDRMTGEQFQIVNLRGTPWSLDTIGCVSIAAEDMSRAGGKVLGLALNSS